MKKPNSGVLRLKGDPKPTLRRRRSTARRLTEEEAKAVVSIEPNSASISERVLLQSILEKERFSQGNELVKTKQEVHANKCKYCPKSFRKPSDLVRHLRIHTGERPYQCPCCNKCFTVKTTAACHMKTHTKERSFNCHLCFKSFSTTGSLKVHMRLHTGSKPFSCPLCDSRFRTSGHKKAHVLSHMKQASKQALVRAKNLEKPLRNRSSGGINDEIERATYNLTDQTSDPKASSNMDNLHCVLSLENTDLEQQVSDALEGEIPSGSQFLVRALDGEGNEDMATHFMVTFSDKDQTNADIQCGEKPSEAGSTILLNKPKFHIKEDTQNDNLIIQKEKPAKRKPQKKTQNKNKDLESVKAKCICEVCGKGFAKEANLVKHMKKCHVTLWSCHVCSEEFETKNDLDMHMVIHVLEQEWLCTLCEQIFPDEASYQSHECLVVDKGSKSLTEPGTLDLGLFATSHCRSQVDVFSLPVSYKGLENSD